MIELNASFFAGFMTAILANCLLAFLTGFFRALFKDRKRDSGPQKTDDVPLRMPKYIDTPVLMTCDKCNGTGEVNIGAIRPVKCNVCFGRGQAFGAIREKFTEPSGPCPLCNGSGQERFEVMGESTPRREPCPRCDGTGRAKEKPE